MGKIQHDYINRPIGKVNVDVTIIISTRVVESVRPIRTRKLAALRKLAHHHVELALELRMTPHDALIVSDECGIELDGIHRSASR